MKRFKHNDTLLSTVLAGLLVFVISTTSEGQQAVKSEVQFNGYTNHWHDTYDELYRYGNLFKIACPQVEKSFLQSKVDIAEELGIPGLLMEEGFLKGLLSESYTTFDLPGEDELKRASSRGDVLAFMDPGTEAGAKLAAELPADWEWPRLLSSHQYGAPDLKRVDLFTLEREGNTLYVVSSADADTRNAVKMLIEAAAGLVEKYKLHKGWFGAYTLENSVTCTKGHPLEVIGTGMNEGNSWFVFDGYMDFMLKDELTGWMNELDLPVVTDVGWFPIYGCKDYDDLQVQQMYEKEMWIEYAARKGGYVFRRVWDEAADSVELAYDGYLAIEGNKEQIDDWDVPFILKTGRLDNHAMNSMVLFLEKDQELTRESMWGAIMDRRTVGVLEMGKMVGPAAFRNPMQMLLLDRVYLEDYFSDRIDLKTEVSGNDLAVTVRNFCEKALYGDVEITLPDGITTDDPVLIPLDIPVNGAKVVHFTLQAGKEAMNRTNPLGVTFSAEGKIKRSATMLDLPPAISVHSLLYGQAPRVNYPVSIHNFTGQTSFPVEVQVIPNGKKRPKYKETKTYQAATGSYQEQQFDLELPPGDYTVKVAALGVEATSQLGVGKANGKPQVVEVDLDGDGVNEYRMENDSVQVTLLANGARVIEYIVKSRNDNVLYKWWPEKALDHNEPFRLRYFYPYGGFEDFLGQPSVETHRVYNVEILQDEGAFVSVKMWSDYFGNRLEKIFTLYGNSPLLEVRFALDFKNFPETNMLAPQPILALGEKHWSEDLFITPQVGGLTEHRMKIDTMFGEAIYLKEGWNAGYDTREDVSFVGAYPVDQLLFLHMWMNTDQNWDSHHYYTEFQPWLFIDRRNTTYFTFYLWGAGGSWERGVEDLRSRNLISVSKKR
ncbi:MAG: carboxypeptidase-like regulatory domain-containing protein [Bacteroidota bacterium]